MRKRLDLYIHDALQEFAEWYVNECPDWLGKERDCVNKFATRLGAGADPGAAIRDAGQIRVECAVKQPSDKSQFLRPAASKDLVIWDDPIKTTWGEGWLATHAPRAIVEWKTCRSGLPAKAFDKHDIAWLTAFTNEYPKTIGFLVSTHATKKHRQCKWAIVRKGKIQKVHIKPKPTVGGDLKTG